MYEILQQQILHNILIFSANHFNLLNFLLKCVYATFDVKCTSCKSIKNMFRLRHNFLCRSIPTKLGCLPTPLVYMFCTNLFVPKINIYPPYRRCIFHILFITIYPFTKCLILIHISYYCSRFPN